MEDIKIVKLEPPQNDSYVMPDVSESENLDITTPDGLEKYMSMATGIDDWNQRTEAVKVANGGYPGFWFGTVIMSGLAAKVEQSWQK